MPRRRRRLVPPRPLPRDSKRASSLGNLAFHPVPVRDDGRFGAFRLGDDTAAPDIFVKIVDGRALPGNAFWVFHAGLTEGDYALTVTDVATGRSKVYQRAANQPGCGGIDTDAFPDPVSFMSASFSREASSATADTLPALGGTLPSHPRRR